MANGLGAPSPWGHRMRAARVRADKQPRTSAAHATARGCRAGVALEQGATAGGDAHTLAHPDGVVGADRIVPANAMAQRARTFPTSRRQPWRRCPGRFGRYGASGHGPACKTPAPAEQGPPWAWLRCAGIRTPPFSWHSAGQADNHSNRAPFRQKHPQCVTGQCARKETS
jgi:hypothetical protein